MRNHDQCGRILIYPFILAEFQVLLVYNNRSKKGIPSHIIVFLLAINQLHPRFLRHRPIFAGEIHMIHMSIISAV